ncbi:MAG TPA: M81 family metallopeptidase [Nitrolancea sp.]|nr:M81 family metallopeptidase [Nitrolancea sp.]
MRIAIANVFHLSNSFNRTLTGRQRWSRASQLASEPVARLQPATYALMQSMIHAAGEHQTTLVPIIEAVAPSGGPSTREAADSLQRDFAERLATEAAQVDALILVLSGCMLDQDGNSIDGALLRAARSHFSNPIVVIWSQFANLSEELLEQADLSLSYDLRDVELARRAGRQAVDLAQRLARLELRPTRAFRKLPFLLPPNAWEAAQEPRRTVEALANEFEAETGVCDVSICTGFPFADDPATGLSLVVSVDDDQELAERLATRVRTAIWTARDAFFDEPINIETAVHEAMQATERPVVITDAGDDPELGASSEGTGMLWALIDLGAQDAALASIVDPFAVEEAIAAGVGKRISIAVGGKTDRSAGYPIDVTAHVRRVVDEAVAGSGRTVRLNVEGRHGGRVDVIVCEQPAEPTPEMLFALGIDLTRTPIIALKSAWRIDETFRDIAARIIKTTTPGSTTPVLAFFDYQRVPRPIYPLDAL